MKRIFDAKLRRVGNSFVFTVPFTIIKKFKPSSNNFFLFEVNITNVTREFDAKIRKVGNSHVVTLPAVIVNKFKLKQNQFITISIDLE